MSPGRIKLVAMGALAMFIVMLLRRKKYPEVSLWKLPIICVVLTICGVLGTMLLFYIENGYFAGTSFFGAILFVPILMLPLLLLHIPYGSMMDICATAECAMLAVMKWDCVIKGCCSGRFLCTMKGTDIYFPSQIAEMIAAVAVLFALIFIDKKSNQKNKLYAWYMIFYGAVRFVLNWFRAEQNPFMLGLTPGCFWGVVCIVLGAVWIGVIKLLEHKK